MTDGRMEILIKKIQFQKSCEDAGTFSQLLFFMEGKTM